MATQIDVDPRILALCQGVTAKRARVVIDHILKHGYISTEELAETYGYDHAPRAARDVREAGVPLETIKVTSSRSGRQIGAYKFGNPSDIKEGRINGRKAFSKPFKAALIQKYGERDMFSMNHVPEAHLSIDHRVPYQVAGDDAFDESNLDAYMLLDGSSQRTKSWSCEHCVNWSQTRDVATCQTCYWASPERYTHVALLESRRTDLQWSGTETSEYDSLVKRAADAGMSVNDYIKAKLKG